MKYSSPKPFNEVIMLTTNEVWGSEFPYLHNHTCIYCGEVYQCQNVDCVNLKGVCGDCYRILHIGTENTFKPLN